MLGVENESSFSKYFRYLLKVRYYIAIQMMMRQFTQIDCTTQNDSELS